MKQKKLSLEPRSTRSLFLFGATAIVTLLLITISFIKSANKWIQPITGKPLVQSTTIYLPFISDKGESTPMPNSQEPTDDRVELEPEWNTYIDQSAGYSFRYPKDWEVIPRYKEQGDLVLLKGWDYYRAIEFGMITMPARQAEQQILAFSINQLNKVYGSEVTQRFVKNQFDFGNIQGIQVTNFPSGTHTKVYFVHDGIIHTATLIEGGEIGGGSPYATETAVEDEQIFYEVLKSLTFHSR